MFLFFNVMIIITNISTKMTIIIVIFSYYDDYDPVNTCGPPQIQNTMMNVTVTEGQEATFKCLVRFLIINIISCYRLLVKCQVFIGFLRL